MMGLAVLSVIYAGILGLIIGSFLNVCIYRIPEGRTVVKGHSMCMTCSNTLKAKDLVPLFSWLCLRGKCRYCGAPVASRYAKIEALTSCIYMIIAGPFIYRFFFTGTLQLSIWTISEFIVVLFIASVLIVSMMIQYDHASVNKGTTIFILSLGAVRFSLLYLQGIAPERIVLSMALGMAVSFFAVIVGVFFTSAPQASSKCASILRGDGFRYYYLPARRMLRLTDILILALGFSVGFPMVIPVAVWYLMGRMLIQNEDKKRFLLLLINVGFLMGYLMEMLGVFNCFF